tara:strand:- start:205 stop:681 length:477 start_codon:yes stop_codon:yes gene_type:complete
MKATFAAGCFWGVEEEFSKIEGVISTKVGYAGGNIPSPTYEMVCSGETDHAEAIMIEYDEKLISYDKLLEVFWKIHDPTTLNRQGLDVGTQYRTAIFYHNLEQKEVSLKSKEKRSSKNIYKNPIVTEIKEFDEFYVAEEYHQKYFQKNNINSMFHSKT